MLQKHLLGIALDPVLFHLFLKTAKVFIEMTLESNDAAKCKTLLSLQLDFS